MKNQAKYALSDLISYLKCKRISSRYPKMAPGTLLDWFVSNHINGLEATGQLNRSHHRWLSRHLHSCHCIRS